MPVASGQWPVVSEATARAFLAGLERQARAEDAHDQQMLAAMGEAYRLARIDNRTRHFQPAARSGDAAIMESYDLLSRRVRNESLNNSQVKKIRDAFEDLIVGPGLATFADPFDPTMDLTDLSQDTLDPLLQYALESDELFEEWCASEHCDVAGKRSLADLQRMAIGECVERGGCLIVRSSAGSGDPRTTRGAGGQGPGAGGQIVPLAYQLIEYEQLDVSKDRPSGTNQNKIVHGIELDASGREVAFWILDDHPYDDFEMRSAGGKSSRVRADRVKHLCLFRRPSQSLGISWLATVGQNELDRDKFLGCEIQKAAKAALLLLVAKLKNRNNRASLGLLDGEDDSDAYGNEEFKLGSSPIAAVVGPDDEIDLVESNYPTAQADSFLNILDHDTAAGMGLSSYTLTGRYDRSNYTSVRGALLAEDAHFRPLQNWFAGQVALPIRREFHRQAIALGKLKSVTAEQLVKNPRRYSRFDAIGAGRDLLDPEAETNAATGRLRACLTTLKQECAKKGQHWIRVLRQIALENRLLDILEIALDLSKGQGGQTVGNTRSKRDQQDALESGQESGASGQGGGQKSSTAKAAKKTKGK